MVDVEKLLCETIEKAGFAIYLQGSIKENEDYNEYGEEFCTYFLNPIDEKFLDNKPVMAYWLFDFNFYSKKLNYALTFENLRNELKKVGFVPIGRGGGAPSDDKHYTGRSVQIRYKENYN